MAEKIDFHLETCMKLWKQLVISLIILVIGVVAWVRFVPGAGAMLAAVGVSAPIIEAIAKPQAAEETAGQGRRGQGQGAGNQTPIVVTQAADVAVVNDRLNAIGNGDAILSVDRDTACDRQSDRGSRQVRRPDRTGAGHGPSR